MAVGAIEQRWVGSRRGSECNARDRRHGEGDSQCVQDLCHSDQEFNGRVSRIDASGPPDSGLYPSCRRIEICGYAADLV